MSNKWRFHGRVKFNFLNQMNFRCVVAWLLFFPSLLSHSHVAAFTATTRLLQPTGMLFDVNLKTNW